MVFQEVSKKFQECLKNVSRAFKDSFKEDWRVFWWRFQWVSRLFERTSKGIWGKFQRYFKGISRRFQGCSKKVFRIFQGRLKGVSMDVSKTTVIFVQYCPHTAGHFLLCGISFIFFFLVSLIKSTNYYSSSCFKVVKTVWPAAKVRKPAHR